MGFFFKLSTTRSCKIVHPTPQNKRPIKSELYQNSVWVYVAWLVFLVVFEDISCPNPDIIPMSKFSLLKMGPNTKKEIFANFVKIFKI